MHNDLRPSIMFHPSNFELLTFLDGVEAVEVVFRTLDNVTL